MAASEALDLVPAPSVADVRACSFTTWHPLFRSHAPRSEVIPLTQVLPSRRIMCQKYGMLQICGSPDIFRPASLCSP